LVVCALAAGCEAPKPNEPKQTQKQLEQVMSRNSALEPRVHALEQANAELQREVSSLEA